MWLCLVPRAAVGPAARAGNSSEASAGYDRNASMLLQPPFTRSVPLFSVQSRYLANEDFPVCLFSFHLLPTGSNPVSPTR